MSSSPSHKLIAFPLLICAPLTYDAANKYNLLCTPSSLAMYAAPHPSPPLSPSSIPLAFIPQIQQIDKLLSATGHPENGKSPKPTWISTPLAKGSIHRMEVEIVTRKHELRFGLVSTPYLHHQLAGNSFHGDKCQQSTAYLLAKDATSNFICRGRDVQQQLQEVNISTGDKVYVEVNITADRLELSFGVNGIQCGTTISSPLPADEFHFGVQFMDHGDAVCIIPQSDASPSLPAPLKQLRILHLSDTHSFHNTIEERFPLPEADIVIHTGDFTQCGREEEFKSFDEWIHRVLRPRYKYVVVIGGNHEFFPKPLQHSPEQMVDPNFLKSRLPSATHVLHHEMVRIEGMNIFGSTWVPWHAPASPGGSLRPDDNSHFTAVYEAHCKLGLPASPHFFDLIPPGVDLLLTHGSAGYLVMKNGWGSSTELEQTILRVKPRAHLFGHIHEQRGYWERKPDGSLEGAVEYKPSVNSDSFPVFRQPSVSYPCQFISNNAMLNQHKIEGVREQKIAGPARLILASLDHQGWTFRNERYPSKWQSRLHGSVLGQALGDALGFLVEGQTATHCANYVEQVLRQGRVCEFGLHKSFSNPRCCEVNGPLKDEVAFLFGQYTDDSQLMRELLFSLARCNGKLDPQDYGYRIAVLFARAGLLQVDKDLQQLMESLGMGPQTPGIVGYGNHTRSAAQKLVSGERWQATGRSQSTSGNGGCMRAGPLGVLLAEQPHLLVDFARNQSRPTHANSRGVGSAVVVAGACLLAVRTALRDEEVNPQEFCDILATDFVDEADTSLAGAVRRLPELLREPPEKARRQVTAVGRGLGDHLWHHGDAISASAVQACLWSLYCFLKHPNNYLECVYTAISAGGDTDTTAAMAGAISGARLGTNQLPENLLARLNDQGTATAVDLKQVANQVFTIAEAHAFCM